MSLAGVKLSRIKKILAQVEKISDAEDPIVSFEFLIGSLYPEVYGNVQEAIRDERTKGFIDGSLGDDWVEDHKSLKFTMLQTELKEFTNTIDKAFNEIREMVNVIDDEKRRLIPRSNDQEQTFVNLILPRITSIAKICQAALLESHLKEDAENED